MTFNTIEPRDKRRVADCQQPTRGGGKAMTSEDSSCFRRAKSGANVEERGEDKWDGAGSARNCCADVRDKANFAGAERYSDNG